MEQDCTSAAAALRRERLIGELRMSEDVLPLSLVAEHFEGKVTPSTIKEYYIKGKRLPQGINLPLPAHKGGNIYFVDKKMLDKWRMGRVEFEDLRPWQKEKFSAEGKRKS